MENWERALQKRAMKDRNLPDSDKSVKCLPHSLRVVIPEKCPRCKEASENIIHGMTKLFEGTTTFKARGTWVDNFGKVVPEDVLVIEASHSCMSGDTEKRFIELVHENGHLANQEMMAVRQGQFYLINTKQEKFELDQFDRKRRRIRDL